MKVGEGGGWCLAVGAALIAPSFLYEQKSSRAPLPSRTRAWRAPRGARCNAPRGQGLLYQIRLRRHAALSTATLRRVGLRPSLGRFPSCRRSSSSWEVALTGPLDVGVLLELGRVDREPGMVSNDGSDAVDH